MDDHDELVALGYKPEIKIDQGLVGFYNDLINEKWGLDNPIKVVRVLDHHPTEDYRSWVDDWWIFLGDSRDIAHEIAHLLDFNLGFDEACKLLDIDYGKEYFVKYGVKDWCYEEEDFAEIADPFVIEKYLHWLRGTKHERN